MSSGEGGAEYDQPDQGEAFVSQHTSEISDRSPHNPDRLEPIRGFDHHHNNKNANRHPGLKPRDASPPTNFLSILETQLGNETSPIPRFEHSEQAMKKAIQDSLGISAEGLATASPDAIKNKLKEDPEAFKFEYLEAVLEGNKKDVIDRQKDLDEKHPEKKVLREAVDIAQQYFWKHPKQDDTKEVYAVKHKDGAWAIHTKQPKDDASIPFSKNTLKDLRESLDLPTAQVATIDKIKEHVTSMKEGKIVSEDDKRLVYGYVRAIIQNLIKVSGLPSSGERKREIDNYLELLYSYEERAGNYRKGIMSKISDRVMKKRK